MTKLAKISILTVLLSLSAIGFGCSDPEFENCTIEIITWKGDSLRLEGAYVEFEGWFDTGPFGQSAKGDYILIQKRTAEWNFRERDIKKMTLIYEAPND